MTSTAENKEKSKSQVLENLKKNTYKLTAIMLIIFSIPAVILALIGKWVNEKFNIAPFGTILMLIIFNIIVLVILKTKILKDIRKTIKEKK